MRRCPLCQNSNIAFFYQDKKRAFFRCLSCQLVFSDSSSHLPPSSQQQRFGGSHHSKKQKQLSDFIFPLLKQLQSLSNDKLIGLTYGRVMDSQSLKSIEEAGHQLFQFDPFLAPNHGLFKKQYDFICCYQVFEHFRNPRQEWRLLQRMLKHGALLAINIQLLKKIELFAKWHHKNNLAHVCFYQAETFKYLAEKSGFTLLFATNDLILMQKPSKSDINANRKLSSDN